MDVQIFIPKGADLTDTLDHGLVSLTEAICQATGEESGYGLGGRFGYGENYENDVFMMHRFCWCERDDCRWCSEDACGCPNPAPKWFIDDAEVTCDQFWEANKKIVRKMPHHIAGHGTPEYEAASLEWEKRIAERDRRLTIVHQTRAHCCDPKGMMADRSEGQGYEPRQTAPNFWHKKSGLKVWWYKYIGRDQRVAGLDGADLQAVFTECIASLQR